MAGGDSQQPELIPRRPLSLGEILGGAVTLYRATAGAAARSVAVVYAPLAVLNALAAAATVGLDPSDPLAGLTTGEAVLLGLSTLVGFLVGPLVGAVVTWLAVERSAGRELGWTEAYDVAKGSFGRIIAASLLLLLLAVVVVGVLALPVALGATAGLGVAAVVIVGLGIPALLSLLALTYLIVPAVVLEDTGPADAVRRAWQLLRVRFWPTLGTVVVAAVLLGLVASAIGIVFSGLSGAAGPGSLAVEAVGSTLSAMLTVPLLTYVALLIYVGAAVRLEGPDAVRLPAADTVAA